MPDGSVIRDDGESSIYVWTHGVLDRIPGPARLLTSIKRTCYQIVALVHNVSITCPILLWGMIHMALFEGPKFGIDWRMHMDCEIGHCRGNVVSLSISANTVAMMKEALVISEDPKEDILLDLTHSESGS